MAPRKVYPPADAERLTALRTGRAATPGAPDQPKPRRTSAQVTKDKRRAEAAKKKKETDRAAAIRAVSEKENAMARADRVASLAANHLPANKVKKVTWTQLRMNRE
jgi:hypothetical protein